MRLISFIQRWTKVWVAAGVVTLVLLIVFVLPQLLVPTDGLKEGPLLKARNDVRSGLLAALALGGAFIGGYVGLRQLELAREQLRHNLEASRRTIDLTRQGQITERFTRAIDQLGSDKLDVRIGGIYSLERIARNSRTDHGPIMEILTAFVREHACKDASPPAQDPQAPSASGTRGHNRPRMMQSDVQAVLTVLGRRELAHEKPDLVLDLSDIDIRNAYLHKAHLERVDLLGAQLEDGFLTEAFLEEAFLSLAHLEGAHLERAHLKAAHLEGAHLEGAHLEGAHLEGAHLEGAKLRGAHLEGATADRDTRWPFGFDPKQAGVLTVS